MKIPDEVWSAYDKAKHNIPDGFWSTLDKGKQMVKWEMCPVSNKPEVCASNLWRLRAIYGGCGFAAAVLAVKILPLIGFDVTGIAAGTLAAAWHSSIGNVAAGSIFATLTSLGATGYGSLMLGSTSVALVLLATVAVKLDWCTCQQNAEKSNAFH